MAAVSQVDGPPITQYRIHGTKPAKGLRVRRCARPLGLAAAGW
jgi:hypothetical protein